MKGPRPHGHVIGLQNRAAACAPVIVQRKDHVLKVEWVPVRPVGHGRIPFAGAKKSPPHWPSDGNGSSRCDGSPRLTVNLHRNVSAVVYTVLEFCLYVSNT